MNRPMYFQLPSAHPEKLAEFYAKSFGWSVGKVEGLEDIWALATGPVEYPGLNGIIMGKFMAYTVNIIQVQDFEQIIQNVVAKGGKITTPKQHIDGMGDFAWCTDPEDNMFVIMLAEPDAQEFVLRAVSGKVPEGISNRPVHFEIPATQPEELAQYYVDVFGWTSQKWDGPLEYIFLMTGSSPATGIDGAIMRRADDSVPVNVIQVLDIEASITTVEDNGAFVLMPAEQIPGVGLFAYALDPDNNQFGLMQFDQPE